MVVQQVLLLAFVLMSVHCHPPNPISPILAGMQRRYGGGGGGYPTLKLPFPIPVKPSLLSKLEDVALDVLYDFRQLVKEEIRNSRTTTTTSATPGSGGNPGGTPGGPPGGTPGGPPGGTPGGPPGGTPGGPPGGTPGGPPGGPPGGLPEFLGIPGLSGLLQQIQDLQRKTDCRTDQLDSPPIRANDASLLGLSFKDDCVQVAIGGQKIFRRCGQASRQRMFRTIPDSPTGAFAGSSVDHDSKLFVKNQGQQFPAISDFDQHPGKFPINNTQQGPLPHKPSRPGSPNPPRGGPPQQPSQFSNHPPMQNHPPRGEPVHPPNQFSNHPPIQSHPPSLGPAQNIMPNPLGSNTWYPQPFNSKSWNMPPHPQPLAGNNWYGPPFDGKSWNRPPYDGKSWNMPQYGGKSWNMPYYGGKSWDMPHYGGKSWDMPHYGGKSWYQPPLGTKTWNTQPFYGKSWYPQSFGTKSWNVPPPGGKSWFPQPLVEPHGFISPEKGGFHGHFHYRGLGASGPPPPPPPPAGAPFDDPYYNKPFDFHKNPIQHTLPHPRFDHAVWSDPAPLPLASEEPATHRRGKSIQTKDELVEDPNRSAYSGREINIPFPSSLKGTLSYPETDLDSVLAKAANIPRKPGDHDPVLVVAMPKEGADARPGEFDSPLFIPLNLPKYEVSSYTPMPNPSYSE